MNGGALSRQEGLTRPNRVVCADTAAKGVSAGSAESMIGYRRRMCRGAARRGEGDVEAGFESQVVRVLDS